MTDKHPGETSPAAELMEDSAGPDVPPDDAAEWTDEQWITWLRATDADELDAGGAEQVRRHTRSRGGAALGNAMLGLSDALYGRQRREVTIVQEAPSEPEPNSGLELHLDPADPALSTVKVHNTAHRHPPSTDGGTRCAGDG